MSNPKKPKVYKTEKSVIPREAFQDLRPKGSDYILMKPDGTGAILINQEEYDWFVKNGVIEKSTDVKLKQFKRSEVEKPKESDFKITDVYSVPTSYDELILSELIKIRTLLENGIQVIDKFV